MWALGIVGKFMFRFCRLRPFRTNMQWYHLASARLIGFDVVYCFVECTEQTALLYCYSCVGDAEQKLLMSISHSEESWWWTCVFLQIKLWLTIKLDPQFGMTSWSCTEQWIPCSCGWSPATETEHCPQFTKAVSSAVKSLGLGKVMLFSKKILEKEKGSDCFQRFKPHSEKSPQLINHKVHIILLSTCCHMASSEMYIIIDFVSKSIRTCC